MKRNTSFLRAAVIYLFIIHSATLPVFSQSSEDFSPAMVEETMDKFTGNLAKSLPFNSSLGLNWSDSYIGNFPHFGVGFSVGMTGIELGSFEKLLDIFSPSLPSWIAGFGVFPIPGYTVEGRIGGFALPFDVGFKFGMMPIKNNPYMETLDYFLIGADIRLSIIDLFVKNKGTLNVLPVVSISAGFNHLNGELGMNAGNDKKCKYPDIQNVGSDGTVPEGTLTVEAPRFTVDWATETLDFKLQISKEFPVVTPYVGIGLSNGWSKAGYNLKTTITAKDSKGNEVDLEDAKAFFKDSGINDLSPSGFSSSREFSGFSTRLFGGLSFNIAACRIDLNGLYNFLDQNYGFSFGVRVQL